VWAAWFASTESLESLARPGEAFVGREGGSETIEALRDDALPGLGYDGQFFLYWALDPREASAYIDIPTYRLSRVLYPLLARVLAFGDPALVPATLLLVNLGAVALGTLALAALLRRRGASPWWALLFAGYPGLYLAVGHDLSEPLAYGLVAGGLYVLDVKGVARPVPAALLFGLAGIARESALVFPAALAACVALGVDERVRDRRRWRYAIVLAGISALPYLALRTVLKGVYGTWFDYGVRQVSLVPFANYVTALDDDGSPLLLLLLSVVAPGLLALAIVAYGVRRVSTPLVLLGANVLVLVAMVPAPSLDDYLAAGRITTGVVVAFVVALPSARGSRARALVWVPILLWLLPWPLVGELAKGT
jgi:hypothetical protein